MGGNNKVSQAVEPSRDDVSITIQLGAAAANGGSANLSSFSPPSEKKEDEEENRNRYRLMSIPEWVRDVNGKAYSPRYISIGPIHRGKDEDEPGIRRKPLKEYYLRRLMQLDDDDLRCFDKEACLHDLRDKEKETRRWYAKDFEKIIKSEDWVEMLLLDGCFVIMYLLDFNFGTQTEDSEHTKWMWPVLRMDLILLENQLPFSVLQCIMRHIITTELSNDQVSELLNRCVFNRWVGHESDDNGFRKVERLLEQQDFKKVEHLLHLIHLAHYRMIYGYKNKNKDDDDDNSGGGRRRRSASSMVYSLIIGPCIWKMRSGVCYSPILVMKLLSWPVRILCQYADPEEEEERRKKRTMKQKENDNDDDEEDEEEEEKNIASATEVHYLGINFRRKPLWLGPKSKYEVRINAYDPNTVDIPRLVVSGVEEPLLHNLIAWEQAVHKNYDEKGHFTKYAFLMYNLINNPQDIALLQRKGILLNKMGTDDEVVGYFKKLAQWTLREPKWMKITSSNETFLGRMVNIFVSGEKSSEGARSNIDEVLEVLKDRVEKKEYQYWAEVKKYLNSPLQVLLVITSFLLFVSTIVPAILSVHTTK